MNLWPAEEGLGELHGWLLVCSSRGVAVYSLIYLVSDRLIMIPNNEGSPLKIMSCPLDIL